MSPERHRLGRRTWSWDERIQAPFLGFFSFSSHGNHWELLPNKCVRGWLSRQEAFRQPVLWLYMLTWQGVMPNEGAFFAFLARQAITGRAGWPSCLPLGCAALGRSKVSKSIGGLGEDRAGALSIVSMGDNRHRRASFVFSRPFSRLDACPGPPPAAAAAHRFAKRWPAGFLVPTPTPSVNAAGRDRRRGRSKCRASGGVCWGSFATKRRNKQAESSHGCSIQSDSLDLVLLHDQSRRRG